MASPAEAASSPGGASSACRAALACEHERFVGWWNRRVALGRATYRQAELCGVVCAVCLLCVCRVCLRVCLWCVRGVWGELRSGCTREFAAPRRPSGHGWSADFVHLLHELNIVLPHVLAVLPPVHVLPSTLELHEDAVVTHPNYHPFGKFDVHGRSGDGP